MLRYLKYFAVALVAVVVLVGAGLALGVLGVPAVTGVDNAFGAVNESTTVIETELGVSNPNPVGVSLGGLRVAYGVAMNGVLMANGSKRGLSVPPGNATLHFTTTMANDRIPRWWYTHVDGGERTRVTIHATATSTTLGQSVSLTRNRSVETDILGGFASNETRPINVSQPPIRDPALYLNGTDAAWDRANLTRQRTPMTMAFTVYNPKPYPYTVTRVGYTVTMNNITVGNGTADRGYVLAPRSQETIEADAAIRNQRLDEWWVSHLQNDQVTRLHVDLYLVVDVQGERVRVNPDAIDHTTTIETDIFGNRASGGDPGGSDAGTPTPTEDEGVVGTTSPVDGTGDAVDTVVDGITGTDSSTGTATPSGTETTDGTETSAGTETSDGGLVETVVGNETVVG